VCFSDGTFGLVQNIVVVDFSVKIIAKIFECANFYEYPTPSSDLGVCLLSNLSESLSVHELSDVLFKCMCLPYGETNFVGIPLVHLIS